MARRQKARQEELTPEERTQNSLVPKEEWPYELQEGWKWVKIGGISDLYNGRAFKPIDWTENGLPIVRIQNLNDQEAEYNYYSGNVEEQYALHGGELLFAWSGTPGTSFGAHIWWGKEAVLNQHIFKMKFDENMLNKRYFMYAINQQLNRLISVAHGGAGLQHVTKGVFENTPIPLPDLSTQERIVSFIDEEFRRLDEAKDQLQSVLNSSEERKQSILHKAFTGELTKKWRDANNVRYEWSKGKLITVLKEKPRNGKSPKPVNYQTSVKSMTLSAVTSGVFNSDYYKYVDIDIEPDSYLWLKKGDILLERSNSLEKVGTSALFTGEDHDFIYPDLMMKLQANERILPEFLAYQLKLNSVMQYFRENATGTAGNMPKINQPTVSNAPILLPTIEEQKEIVRIIDQYMQKEIASSEVLNMTIDQIEETRTSVLSQAFHGELNL